MSDERNGGASGILLSFILGGLTGAALAILFAPRSGRETREILGERIRDGVGQPRVRVEDDVVGREVVQVDPVDGAVPGALARLPLHQFLHSAPPFKKPLLEGASTLKTLLCVLTARRRGNNQGCLKLPRQTVNGLACTKVTRRRSRSAPTGYLFSSPRVSESS